MLATGRQKLERMRDGRVVYIGAERVDDVTAHPAFRQRRRDRRRALRPQGRSGQGRAVLLRGERRALRPAMAALPQPRRPRAPHARAARHRGGDLRLHRPLARAGRGPDHRARDESVGAGEPARGLRREPDPLLRARPPRRSLSLLCGDAADRHARDRAVPRPGARRSQSAGGGRGRCRRHRLRHEDARHQRDLCRRDPDRQPHADRREVQERGDHRGAAAERAGARRCGRASPMRSRCGTRPTIRCPIVSTRPTACWSATA